MTDTSFLPFKNTISALQISNVNYYFPRPPSSIYTRVLLISRAQAASAADRKRYFVPKRIRDLSCTDHRVVLCEYLEQTPLIMSNVGMASSVVTYYKPRSDADADVPAVEDGTVTRLADTEPFVLIQV